MKNEIGLIVCAVLIVALLSACTLEEIGIGSNAHDVAVQKISEYVENAINKKIDQSENLSDAGKAKLKAEVVKLKEEILVRIAKIKEKAEAGDIPETEASEKPE